MRTYDSIALGVPETLLPREGTDLAKWAVIACDQYTSEPEYWAKTASIVGGEPSTLNLIYPEVFLHEAEAEKSARIARIRETMSRYLGRGLFQAKEGMVYVERTTGSHTRRGLVACLDLEAYDYRKGSTTLIRATEGTILDRIPPRVRIREGAALESPHIMVLIDDPADTVIGPLAAAKARMPRLYDFELMLGSGHLVGHQVSDPAVEAGIVRALKALVDPAAFASKYGLPAGTPVLLYAMGDGNHSLATAKTIWETTKAEAADRQAVLSSPLRYAMVELVNLHDRALVFEPIHRVVFDVAAGRDLPAEARAFFGGQAEYIPACCSHIMQETVEEQAGRPFKIGLATQDGFGLLEISAPGPNLPVGSLQGFLDSFLKSGGAREIDYVHGAESTIALGSKPGNWGFILPAMRKEDLFKTVILDGVTPRKTFSLGEAWEKRFYMEARRLG
ncbi:MAG: DUF1015 domain-containing protein [Acidobacteriota bacterium]|nr:DUF1015 domain-containing protein [Acidobacteriota bacterium]